MDFKQFQLSISAAIDEHVQFAWQSHAYEYTRGEKRPVLKAALDRINNYFNLQRPAAEQRCWYADRYSITVLMAQYGTMPCYLVLTFDRDRIRVTMLRAITSPVFSGKIQGKPLYAVEVSTTMAVEEFPEFQNILK